MSNLITPRLVPILLAGLLLPACASPFARTPKPPQERPTVEGAAYSFTPETQHEFRIKGLKRVEQRRDTWCWAACAEMVTRRSSGTSTQDDFVAGILELPAEAEVDEQAATWHEILLALSPGHKERIAQLWEDLMVRAAAAVAAEYYAQTPEEVEYARQMQFQVLAQAALVGLGRLDDTVDLDTALADLQDGEPVIVGLTELNPDGTSYGHACVLVGLRASYAGPRDAISDAMSDIGKVLTGRESAPAAGVQGESGYVYLEATLVDPAQGRVDERTMPATELMAKARFFASRPFAQKFLEREVQLLSGEF